MLVLAWEFTALLVTQTSANVCYTVLVVFSLYLVFIMSPPYLQAATSKMWCWSGERDRVTKLPLYASVVCKSLLNNGTSSYYRMVWLTRLSFISQSSVHYDRITCLCTAALYSFFSTVYVYWSYSFNMMNWALWDWRTIWVYNCPPVLQCFDAVGLVIRPVKMSSKWPILCWVGR